MLLEDILSEFLIDCRIRNLAKSTIDSYRRNILIVIKHHNNEDIDTLENVSKVSVKKMIIEMQNEGYQEGYINSILKSFKAMFKYIHKENYIPENFMREISLLKEPKRILKTFNDEELINMIEFYNKAGFLNQRNKLIIELFVETGLRVAELRSIQNHMIRADSITIVGKGNVERVVPISPYLAIRIKKYSRSRDDYFRNLRNRGLERVVEDYLFVDKSGKRMKSNVMIEKIVNDSAKAVGVREEVTRKSCHSLRHYFAQKLLKSGVNVYTISRLLGHSNIRTTQTYLNSLSDKEILDSVIEATPLMQLIKEGKM